jgi:hypothetical protein
MSLKTQYKEKNTDAIPTIALWADCPIEEIKSQGIGYLIQDDFQSFGGTVATNVGTYDGGYKSFETTNTSLKTLTGAATDVGGIIRLLTTANDGEEVSFANGYDLGGPFRLLKHDPSAGTPTIGKKLWYETRVRFAQIVTQDAILALTEEGLAVNDGWASDADAQADKDMVGFRILAATSSAVDAIHQKAGGSGATVVKAAAQTIVANTWYKFGMTYDPSASTNGTLTWYVNGTEVGNITNLGATKFPNGDKLNSLIGIKNSTAAISSLDVDWLWIAQMR